MGALLEIALIVSITVWIVGSGSEGAFSPQTAAIILFALVALAVYAKKHDKSIVKVFLRFGLAIAGLLTFAIWKGHGDWNQITGIVGGIALIVIALCGVYVMLFRLFGAKRRRHRR
jgi:hypothetical protein